MTLSCSSKIDRVQELRVLFYSRGIYLRVYEGCAVPPARRAGGARLRGRPDPKIKANEILVRVRACALNHLDLFVRAGIPGMNFHMPHILGSDIAGRSGGSGRICASA